MLECKIGLRAGFTLTAPTARVDCEALPSGVLLVLYMPLSACWRRQSLLLCLPLLLPAAGDALHLASDAAFEESIIMSPHVHAVLFTSKTRDANEANKLMLHLEATLPGVTLAQADVDDVKAVASEFNVRRRMVPRMLLFSSRARQATVIKLGEGPLNFEEVLAALKEGLAENKEQDAEGRYKKLTLAIGGGGDEL